MILLGYFMGEIKEVELSNWLHLINTHAKEKYKESKFVIYEPNPSTNGKYMFFSYDKKLLIKIGKEILLKYIL